MTVQTIMDTGIIAGSVILMVFCFVLTRRLRRLNDLEDGLGAAIAIMSAEVDRLEKSVRAARQEALEAGKTLAAQVQQAQSERAKWDLHLKMRDAVPDQPVRAPATRLRKRREAVDA